MLEVKILGRELGWKEARKGHGSERKEDAG